MSSGLRYVAIAYPPVGARDQRRVVGPHVDDRGGNGDGRGGVQDPFHKAEVGHRPGTQAKPGGRVAEGFGLDDERGAGRVVVDGAEPSAEGPELQGHRDAPCPEMLA